MPTGTLYLIPSALDEGAADPGLPSATVGRIGALRDFVVETPKAARRLLKAAGHPGPMSELGMQVLDEHTRPDAVEGLLAPLLAGRDLGLLSDAGCPGVADPGAALVAAAHARGITVRPLVGPSAILLALMASGLEGQRFCFHGYLPVDGARRAERLRQLERQSAAGAGTQLFIEAPYRNDALLGALTAVLAPATRLCVATDLTGPREEIRTLRIEQWRTLKVSIDRRPTVFAFLAPPDAARR